MGQNYQIQQLAMKGANNGDPYKVHIHFELKDCAIKNDKLTEMGLVLGRFKKDLKDIDLTLNDQYELDTQYAKCIFKDVFVDSKSGSLIMYDSKNCQYITIICSEKHIEELLKLKGKLSTNKVLALTNTNSSGSYMFKITSTFEEF